MNKTSGSRYGNAFRIYPLRFSSRENVVSHSTPSTKSGPTVAQITLHLYLQSIDLDSDSNNLIRRGEGEQRGVEKVSSLSRRSILLRLRVVGSIVISGCPFRHHPSSYHSPSGSSTRSCPILSFNPTNTGNPSNRLICGCLDMIGKLGNGVLELGEVRAGVVKIGGKC